jgi:hypothetical protein
MSGLPLLPRGNPFSLPLGSLGCPQRPRRIALRATRVSDRLALSLALKAGPGDRVSDKGRRWRGRLFLGDGRTDESQAQDGGADEGDERMKRSS